MGWRFFAHRLNGDGTETGLHPELPVTSCDLTEMMSAPMAMKWTLKPESVPASLFVPWQTALYAELDGVIRAAGIIKLDGVESADEVLTLSTIGWPGYIDGMPWCDLPADYISRDPGSILPILWAKVQAHLGGNIGLQVPAITTGKTVGTPAKYKTVHGKRTKQSSAEPFRLATWATANLAQTMADLLKAGAIEYREVHRWDGDQIVHELLLASPRLGRRLHEARLVISENVDTIPTVEPAEYASEVLVLGAGEATKKITSLEVRTPVRLRRVHVINVETVTRREAADTLARSTLDLLTGTADDTEQIVVHDSPAAPIGLLVPGDEVRLTGDAGWAGQVDVWLRITQRSWNPITTPDEVTLSVVRADKVRSD